MEESSRRELAAQKKLKLNQVFYFHFYCLSSFPIIYLLKKKKEKEVKKRTRITIETTPKGLFFKILLSFLMIQFE